MQEKTTVLPNLNLSLLNLYSNFIFQKSKNIGMTGGGKKLGTLAYRMAREIRVGYEKKLYSPPK